MATARGNSLGAGLYIRTAQGLSYIVAHPDDHEAGALSFTAALSSYGWGNVVLQPYGGSLPDTRAAIGSLIGTARANPASANAKVFVYGVWPARSMGEYSAAWTSPYNGSAASTFTRDFERQLMQAVRQDNAGLPSPVTVIPVGEIFYAIDQQMAAGQFPGGLTDISAFYRDDLHANNLGRYTAIVAHYAALFGEDPRGLPIWTSGVGPGITPAQAAAIQQATWDVMTTHPDAASIPEPISAALLGVAAVGLLARRRRRHGGS